jgi:hypothetical protein
MFTLLKSGVTVPNRVVVPDGMYSAVDGTVGDFIGAFWQSRTWRRRLIFTEMTLLSPDARITLLAGMWSRCSYRRMEAHCRLCARQ